MTLMDLGTWVIAIATAASLFSISRQVSMTRRQTKGQFIIALDERLEKSKPITLRLFNEEGFRPNGSEWLEIWQLMSIFERINIMVDDHILDVALVDRLYGFLLRRLVAHDDIYERLGATGAEWQDFIDLCHLIAEYHQNQGTDKQDTEFIKRVNTLDKSVRRLNNPWRV